MTDFPEGSAEDSPQRDDLLAMVAHSIEAADAEVAVMLSIPGATVSGIAVSSRRYFNHLYSTVRATGHAGFLLAEFLEPRTTGSDPGPPRWLHLRDVEFIGAPNAPRDTWYRVSIAQIAGFSLFHRLTYGG